jgi:hypothetical protein
VIKRQFGVLLEIWGAINRRIVIFDSPKVPSAFVKAAAIEKNSKD